jgi:hypothetical protein
MSFASEWLRGKALFPQFITDRSDPETGIITVVPAYNEPQVSLMLDSLLENTKPDCQTEVIIVINAPINAPSEHKAGNRKAIENIMSWKKMNENSFFRLFVIEPDIEFSGWGVGMARKTGMDEALRRFNMEDNSEGVILCLDADCTVRQNYLSEVCNELYRRRDRNACSIYFEHPLSGVNFPDSYYCAIARYELHLRYYYQGLKYSGFPYAFQTTGSAMAVKAATYMKAGGMNRKQAGEDFYFIQKLAPSPGYFYLNTTTVYPSPRKSMRVPFGTGATMSKIAEEQDKTFFTYNPAAFMDLKKTFLLLPEIYKDEVNYRDLPGSIKSFVPEEEWKCKLSEIRNNTGSNDAFIKRFFTWFNMFKIVKFLNFVHQDNYQKVPVEEASAELLEKSGLITGLKGIRELLDYFRSLEKMH